MLDKVRAVEIEIHSFCNRVCQWCPNKFIDRHTLKQLPEELYLKLLNELKVSNFSGVISYSRYNEPFADIRLLILRTRQAKELLPHVKLVTNTNGDYLTEEKLDAVCIDELSIMDYDNKGLDFCINRLDQLGVKIESIDYPYIYGSIGPMKIVYVVDWAKNALIEDRGGSLEPDNIDVKWKNNRENRQAPCFEPKYFIGIDYNGNVVPCCHIRSDNPLHRDYILGNIADNTIDNIYNGGIANSFRECLSYGLFPKACDHCQKDEGRYTRDNPDIKF